MAKEPVEETSATATPSSTGEPDTELQQQQGQQPEDGWLPGEKYNWYRGVFFQATVVGVVAFVAPGLWNAMNTVGAGGQQKPYLVMAGNALLFSLMTLTCLSGSLVANRIGLKYTLMAGSTGYSVYSAALYVNNRYGTEWFVYLGSAICGISAGLLWASEGAIMVSYPAARARGRYLAYWLCYRNSGSILGGIINLAFNARGTGTGKLDWRTYIAFVSLQCIGPAVVAFLSPPEKVRRRDGSRVRQVARVSDRDELRALARVIRRPEMLLLAPLYIYATWPIPYAGSYMALYFSVRARALASLVAALAQVLATFIVGFFLDWERFSLPTRARAAFIFTMALSGGCWVWGVTVQRGYSQQAPGLDWSDTGFGRGWALYIFWQVNFALTYNYGYWLIGHLAKEPADVARIASYARALESAGQTISSGISSTPTSLLTCLAINFGVWGVSVVPAYLVVHRIGHDLVGYGKEAEAREEEEPQSTKP